jgi:hypothetical protein
MVFLAVMTWVLVAVSAAEAAVEVNHGVFTAGSVYLSDPAVRDDYKTKVDQTRAGTLVSQYQFAPEQGAVWSSPTWLNGGMIYTVSSFTGLKPGDIIEIKNNYLSDEGSGFVSYWDQARYWIEVGAYTHKPGDTINSWLMYGDQTGGTWFNISSGQYYLVGGPEELPLLFGDRFELVRDYKVYDGDQYDLLNPTKSSRGYWTSSTGVTGSGTPLLEGEFVALTEIIPEPATIVVWGLLGVVAAGYGVWRRRRTG